MKDAKDVKDVKAAKTARFFEAARLVRGPLIILVVYLVLRAIFGALTEHGGLVSPSGDVSLGVAALGGLVLVLRLVVLFVLPAVVVYRGCARILERLRSWPKRAR